MFFFVYEFCENDIDFTQHCIEEWKINLNLIYKRFSFLHLYSVILLIRVCIFIVVIYSHIRSKCLSIFIRLDIVGGTNRCVHVHQVIRNCLNFLSVKWLAIRFTMQINSANKTLASTSSSNESHTFLCKFPFCWKLYSIGYNLWICNVEILWHMHVTSNRIKQFKAWTL